jgi:threonine/homoserine/homoserine lactone efflux protein
MSLYPVFLLVAAATVASPGPGVLLTLTNALRYGFRGTFAGILGIAVGALFVAALSATGLGVLLATSAAAFTVIKTVGAAYLIVLGVRLWFAPAPALADDSAAPDDGGSGGAVSPQAHEARRIHSAAPDARRFLEGLSLQLTNPKAIFFFLSVFPQFVDRASGGATPFAVLVLTYASLVVTIHCAYALTARRARRWLTSPRGGRAVNRIGGATFVCFGAALATARRA